MWTATPAAPESTRRRREPFHWRDKLPNGQKVGIIPDRVFGLKYIEASGKRVRAYYFLEADRGSMHINRRTPSQSSFQRKLLATKPPGLRTSTASAS